MKEIRRDFTVVAEVPDHVGVDEVEITVTAVASYAEQTVEPKVLAEEPYVVEPAPDAKPQYGTWTICSCGHIAQEHDKTGKCERVGCTCLKYGGICVPAES